MKLDARAIARHFRVSFARSSGKGGQHVNTTDSKALIQLTPQGWVAARGAWIQQDRWDTLMENYKEGVAGKRFPYFTPKMGVRVASEESRVRANNLEDCFTRFCKEVEKCSEGREETSEDTKKRWRELKKRDETRRLESKRRLGDKKRARKVSLD